MPGIQPGGFKELSVAFFNAKIMIFSEKIAIFTQQKTSYTYYIYVNVAQKRLRLAEIDMSLTLARSLHRVTYTLIT